MNPVPPLLTFLLMVVYDYCAPWLYNEPQRMRVRRRVVQAVLARADDVIH